jgi:hypothetical protein
LLRSEATKVDASTNLLIKAFASGILKSTEELPQSDSNVDTLRFYFETVSTNIEEFLKTHAHLVIRLDDSGSSFSTFLDKIGASGDLESCKRMWRDHCTFL